MRGNVIGFDPDTNTGAISGHDGNRYDFVTQDWRGRSQPRHGDIVDFQAQGGRALDIYLIAPEYVPPGFWRFYFSPTGRLSRSQFWLRWVLPVTVIGIILFLITFIVAIISWGPSSSDLQNRSDLEEHFRDIITVYAITFFLVTVWTDCIVLAKRMHDRDKPGWMVFFCLIPRIASMVSSGVASGIFGLIGLVIFIWFFIEFGCLRGTVGPNRHGPDPVR
ncbi:MAG: DUF805 domain-containing protein [Stellaceae bacterium]